MYLKRYKANGRINFLGILSDYNILFTFVIMLIVATTITKGSYIQFSNLTNLLIRGSVLGIVAIGQTLVILTAGIDLSVGAIMGLVFAVIGKNIQIGINSVPLILLIGILLGVICGFLNGLIISRTIVPPFIVTLATSMIFMSTADFLVGGQSLRLTVPQKYIKDLIGDNRIILRTFPILVWLILALLITLLLKYTKVGNNIYAIGVNAEASMFVGINIMNTKIVVYTLSGTFSALAATVMIYQLGGVNPEAGNPFLLMSIAAVIIGGVNLFGGEGEIIGTVIGVIVVISLFNIMNLVGVNPYVQDAIAGSIVVFFVFFLRYLANIRSK